MMMLIYEDVPVISCEIRIFERLDDDLQICLITSLWLKLYLQSMELILFMILYIT